MKLETAHGTHMYKSNQHTHSRAHIYTHPRRGPVSTTPEHPDRKRRLLSLLGDPRKAGFIYFLWILFYENLLCEYEPHMNSGEAYQRFGVKTIRLYYRPSTHTNTSVRARTHTHTHTHTHIYICISLKFLWYIDDMVELGFFCWFHELSSFFFFFFFLPTPPLGQDMTQGQFFLSGV